MFTGIQEILVLVIVVLGILFLPRLMPKDRKTEANRPAFEISPWMRFALVLSLLWPVLTGIYFQPWKKDLLPFLYASLGPVALGWGVWWIYLGFEKKRKLP